RPPGDERARRDLRERLVERLLAVLEADREAGDGIATPADDEEERDRGGPGEERPRQAPEERGDERDQPDRERDRGRERERVLRVARGRIEVRRGGDGDDVRPERGERE